MIWDLEKTKLSKKEYLESLDPDNLNLKKEDLLNFCHKCVDEWKANKVGNFKFIIAMELIIAGIKITGEDVLKAVWKKILVWFWDLQFQNALEEEDGMLKRLRELGTG